MKDWLALPKDYHQFAFFRSLSLEFKPVVTSEEDLFGKEVLRKGSKKAIWQW